MNKYTGVNWSTTTTSGFLPVNGCLPVNARIIILCWRSRTNASVYLQNRRSGLVFMKGLRLSQVLGLNPVLKLRLLSQLSFVLKPYSQRVT